MYLKKKGKKSLHETFGIRTKNTNIKPVSRIRVRVESFPISFHSLRFRPSCRSPLVFRFHNSRSSNSSKFFQNYFIWSLHLLLLQKILHFTCDTSSERFDVWLKGMRFDFRDFGANRKSGHLQHSRRIQNIVRK